MAARCSNGDLARCELAGIGNRGRLDGRLACLQRLDLAVVNGDRGSIGALPSNALVCSQPRIDVCLQGDGRALEQRDLRGNHLDAGYLCILGKRDRVGGNNEQADNMIIEQQVCDLRSYG